MDVPEDRSCSKVSLKKLDEKQDIGKKWKTHAGRRKRADEVGGNREKMEIRRLEPEEHGRTRSLYETVFSEDSPSFVEYYYREKTKDNQIYVLEEDGGIRTMLHLNPYRVEIEGDPETLHYIVAVATEEAYRKRGYMGKVLKRAMEEMYRAGESFTFLMPAAEKIYTPYGFRTVCRQCKKYVTRTEAEKGEEAKAQDCREMADRANSLLKKEYQVYARRDTAYYERLLKEYASDGAKVILYRAKGVIEDYGILLADGESIPKEEPKIMIRIIHLLHFLSHLHLCRDTGFYVEIEDPWVTENCGTLHLHGRQGGTLQAVQCEEGKKADRIKIEDLGAYLFGALPLEDWKEEAGLGQETAEGLASIIPLSKIFLNETV